MRNPLSINEFAAFCERQPANKKYNYNRAKECAVAQFLQANGVVNYILYSWEIPETWQDPVYEQPWTFGDLSVRLRAASTSGRT